MSFNYNYIVMVTNENEQMTPVAEVAEQKAEAAAERAEATTDVTNATQKMLDYQRLAVGTQIESNNLQLEVKSDFLKKLDEVLEKYKNLYDDVRRLSGNNPNRKHFEEVLKDCIKDIKTMKKNVSKNKSGTDFNKLRERIAQMESIYPEYQENYQRFILGQEDVKIRSFVDGKKDAKRDAEYQELSAKNLEKINRILSSAATEALRRDNQADLKQYLIDVINGGVDPHTHRFYITHKNEIEGIKVIDPNIYTELKPQGNRVNYETYSQCYPGHRVSCRPQSRDFASNMGNTVADIAESRGANKDQDPRKRQAWVNAGKVVTIGGAIFLGFQFFKNLFSKSSENKNKWWKTAGYGVGLLALMNNGKLRNWVHDITGWHPGEQAATAAALVQNGSEKEQNEMSRRFVDAPITVLSALSFIPIKSRKDGHIVKESSNGLEFDKTNYMTYVNACVASGSLSPDDVQNLEKAANKLQDPDFFRNGLKSLGIDDMNKINELSRNPDMMLKDSQHVQESYRSHVESMTSGIHSELYKKGLIAKDVDALEKITREYKEGEDLNTQIIQWMKAGLLSFADNDNDRKYTMEEMLNNPDIDLENMTMKGLDIKFDSYAELFDVVNLTNWIKRNFKGKPAISERPFHIAIEKFGRIEFDNTEWYGVWKNETDVLKARTIKKTSSLLSKNKQVYVNYLNDWRSTEGREKVNLGSYTLLNATGIDFYDKNEAQAAEHWLQKIKESKKFSSVLPGSTPFSIKYVLKKAGDRLVFTAVNGDEEVFDENIKNYPTLMNNKEKLLNFLNNPSNKMRGSAI